MQTQPTLAFIGLGVMGGPMAGHLATAGYPLQVYNRTSSKADAWVKGYSGQSFTTPKAAAENADIVFLCVGADDDVRQVVTGKEGVLASLKPNAVIIDHTTASASLAKEMYAACKEQGVHFLDAPVSGGEPGAINAQLTVMVGGDEAAFKRTQHLMQHLAKAVTYMGETGSGQLTKMVNQICIGGLLQGLAEGLNFAGLAGLNRQKVVDVISQGAAGSWQMVNRHKTMLADEYNHGFAVDLMRKDFGICFNEAQNLGASLPVTALVDQFYAEVQQMGGNKWDTSSLLKRLEALNLITSN